MSEFNPYAAPKVEVKPIGEGDQEIWSDGRSLFLTKGAVLPDRCVKCNGETGGYKLKRNLSWHHPLIYLVILFNLIIYVIVALIVRKTARVDVGLCRAHRARRRTAIAVGWLGGLGGIAIMISAAFVDPSFSALVVLAGVAVLLACVIYGVTVAQVVRPTKIDDRIVTLGGCGREFLLPFMGRKEALPDL